MIIMTNDQKKRLYENTDNLYRAIMTSRFSASDIELSGETHTNEELVMLRFIRNDLSRIFLKYQDIRKKLHKELYGGECHNE